MLALHQASQTRQQPAMSPRLQHAVRLLQLSSSDFAMEVQAMIGRNPFLEATDPGEPLSHDHDAAQGHKANRPAASAVVQVDELHHRHVLEPGVLDPGVVVSSVCADAAEGAGSGLRDPARTDEDLSDASADGMSPWLSDAAGSARSSGESVLGVIDLTAWEPGLAMQLHAQLHVLRLPPRDAALAHAVVDSLDEDGYLRITLQEVADASALVPDVSLAEMKIALARVQSLEPAGVAARSVAECLILQLPTLNCPEMRALARRILSEHLSTLARHDLARLARDLGRPLHEVQAVCDRIRRLDPRPGWRYSGGVAPYVVPDVVARKQYGAWVAQLNSALVPRLRVNRHYANLFQRHRTPNDRALAEHLQEARWMLRHVEQRCATILQVAQAIVERQHRFLEHGPMAMRPLGLKEIAGALGLHESTVSRVTRNKYLMTPSGVYELKYFFSRALTTQSGRTCSATALRSLIRDLIEAEAPGQPLSDAAIAGLLATQGVRLARRTVTKYRQMLRIDPVEQRRAQSRSF